MERIERFSKQLDFDLADYQPLFAQVVQQLRHTKRTITAAESLTAGLFQSTLASVSGASSVFGGGFVTYSLEMKSMMLKIDAYLLHEHGVVSSFTAKQMAIQSAKIIGSDFGVGLTGVAGPEMLEDQPVGTVYIGVSHAEQVDYQKFIFKGNRQMIREKSVVAAFIMLASQL